MAEQRTSRRQQHTDLLEELFQLANRGIENDLERSAGVGGTVPESELVTSLKTHRYLKTLPVTGYQLPVTNLIIQDQLLKFTHR
jgi:hypothetical protein